MVVALLAGNQAEVVERGGFGPQDGENGADALVFGFRYPEAYA